MNQKILLLILFVTLIFPWLFYENLIGINLFFYNLLVIGGLKFAKKITLESALTKVILSGTVITAIMVVLINSSFVITINILSLFLLSGISLFPKARDFFSIGITSIINFFYSQYSFISLFNKVTSQSKVSKAILRFFQIVLLPVGVVIIFMLIYKTANPVFEGYIGSVIEALNDFYQLIIDYIELSLILVTIFGLIVSNFLFLGKPVEEIVSINKKLGFNLKHGTYENQPVTVEYRSAVVLFSMLNILLLIVNIIDINWFWFGFEWNGDYLKQFVHEGTYLLIFSIIISLSLSVFFFRGKLNFIKNNGPLKLLAFVWLGQNAILAISVGIRNFWYIHYFSLAYLRIGVIFFLILTLFSIYTVYQKIRKKKTTYYLFSINTIAVYVVLLIISLFNWDIIIARYNFTHTKTAFLHYNFMSDLSNSALPYLIKSKDELKVIDKQQKDIFSYTSRNYYMTSDDYFDVVESRKELFIEEWPRINWQEWNLADEIAYQKLTRK